MACAARDSWECYTQEVRLQICTECSIHGHASGDFCANIHIVKNLNLLLLVGVKSN